MPRDTKPPQFRSPEYRAEVLALHEAGGPDSTVSALSARFGRSRAGMGRDLKEARAERASHERAMQATRRYQEHEAERMAEAERNPRPVTAEQRERSERELARQEGRQHSRVLVVENGATAPRYVDGQHAGFSRPSRPSYRRRDGIAAERHFERLRALANIRAGSEDGVLIRLFPPASYLDAHPELCRATVNGEPWHRAADMTTGEAEALLASGWTKGPES